MLRRRLWAPGLPTPTLFLDFLTGLGANLLASTVSNLGTYVGPAGTLVSAQTNVPRLEYDPVTLLPKGLLSEAAATNLYLNSATLVTQTNTVLNSTSYTVSFYGTGTVVLAGAATATIVGTGTNVRTVYSFLSASTSLVSTVSGSVTNAQLQATAYASSYIPTTSVAVTRPADAYQLAVPPWAAVNPNGSTVIVSFDQNTGSTGYTGGIWAALANPAADTTNFFSLVGALAGASVAFEIKASSNLQTPVPLNRSAPAVSYVAGAIGTSITPTAVANGGSPVFYEVSGTRRVIALPLAPTRLNVGATNNGGALNGHVRTLAYYNSVLSIAQMQALT